MGSSLVSWSARVRIWVSVLIGLVAVALVMTMSPETASADPKDDPSPAAPSDQPSPSGQWVSPTGADPVRPDMLSASLTARSSGHRVEVLSARTESSRSWVLPTGAVESEATGEVRFKDPKETENDGWRDIDTTLVAGADGTVAPKAVPGSLKLSGGGDADALINYLSESGRSVKLGTGLADAVLPKPTLDGATATYPDVLPGVDVRVEARPSGFEQLWVIKDQTGLDNLIKAHGDGDTVSLEAPLTLAKTSAAPAKDGSVAFTDSNDKKVAELQSPTMWDDATDAKTGRPASVESVDFTVTAGNTELTPLDPAKTGKLALAVDADQDWLTDPDRQFPIMIDPTYEDGSSQVTFDTYVRNGDTVDHSTDGELWLGYDGTAASRSFLNVSASGLAGRKIMSGSLTLWETWSASCTASAWSAYTAGAASTSTRWTAQPTIGSKYAASTATKGFSGSCAAGEVSIDMKSQLQAWADAGTATQGLLLRADTETDPLTFKRFESNEGAHAPKLTWTSNRAPDKTPAPLVAGATPYKAAGDTAPVPYTAATKPTVSAVLTDSDADTMTATFQASTSSSFGTIASSCTSGSVASNATASCALSTALATDGRYYLRVRAQDSNGAWGAYSDTVEFRVASVAPAAPVISCPGYTSDGWTSTVPTSDVSCTVTAVGTGYSAPAWIRWSLDGNPLFVYTPITQSSSTSVAKTTLTLPKTPGGHSIRAHAVGPAGVNTASSFYTGWGTQPLLKLPRPANARITTPDTVQIMANGPGTAGTVSAKTQWRVSGAANATDGWVDAPAGNALTVTQHGGQSQADGILDTTTLVGLSDASGATVRDRVPVLIDVRTSQTTGSTTTYSAEYATILRAAHAFGSNYPTTDAGPGQAALWTGELSVDDSDASISTPTGGLSVSRSHMSFASTPAVQNKVFGTGWVASFDGDDSGAGGAELYDGTTDDGTLDVLSADGDALVFSTPVGAPARRTSATIPTGTYRPADDDTKTSGTTLVVSGSGASTIAELTSDDGIVTKFQVTAAPTTAPATFRTVEVREPATGDKSTYSYDSSGRVTAITAALPDGVSSCTPGTPAKGCRVLKITYATVTTATSTLPGDFKDQVKTISAQVNTDSDRELAAYKYDNNGRMMEAKDSRTGLTTTYTWTGFSTAQRLASITPPGQATYTFNYDTSANKIKSVTRPIPASAGGGTAQLAAFVYGVPTTGTGLPDMPTTTNAWLQAKTPTWGAAVFGPDQVISGTTPAAVTDTEWWKRADLSYTDDEGRTVNTVGWGAGDWQYTASDYDSNDNVIRAWDQRGTRAVLNGDIGSGGADQYATLTTYNADITDGTNVITPAGTLVTDSYGPMQQVVSSDGSLQMLRTHTKTLYDQNAPTSGINTDTGQPYRLPTTVTTTSEAADGTVNQTLTRTFTGYDALVAGDTTGWALGQATSSTVDMDLSNTVNSGDITTKTRYDAKGRVVENRQPKSTGSDAGTRVTAYYTGASTGTTGCTSKPEWAGMVCQVGPAAQPSGQTIPVTKTTSYTWDLQTATTVDTSGSVTSTSTTTFDSKDRPSTSSTTVTGLASSTALPAVTTSYDDSTGQVTGTTSTAGSTAMTYDNWGRQLTYTNTPAGQTADTGTTTYNALGQVTSVVDGNGQTAYTYDGTDANGNTEYRGLVTAVKVKLTGGTEYTSTGAYDHAGALTTEKFPGNIIRRTTIDATGHETGMSYNGQTTDSGGAFLQDQPWIAWTSYYTPLDQLNRQFAPNSGAAVRGKLGNTASALNRSFGYDRAGRLTFAKERYTNGDLVGANQQCVSRTYAFDANGNRTSNNTVDPAGDGSCTTTGGSPISHAYDAADRPTTGGGGAGSYVYDELGRQTTIPAVDAPHNDRGNITLGYYDSDAIKTITQNGQTTSFTLDGAARRLNQTTASNTLVRHYSDSGDNPTWTVDTTGSTTTTTRYNELIDGDLGLTLTTVGGTTTAQFDLATPRNDIAATVTLPTGATAPGGTSAVGIGSWTDYNEYGIPRQSVDTTPGGVTGIGYGWLGTKQRATLETGLTLMGARLYNQATGLFTSIDPEFGGNSTSYGYPNDPVNSQDLDGHRRVNWRKVWKYTAAATGVVAAVACIVATVGVCGVAGAVALAGSLAWNGYRRYKKEISWRQFGRNVGTDLLFSRVRAVRAVKYFPRRASYGRPIRSFTKYAEWRHANSWRTGGRRGYRSSWRAHPYRARARLGYNVYSGWNSYGTYRS